MGKSELLFVGAGAGCFSETLQCEQHCSPLSLLSEKSFPPPRECPLMVSFPHLLMYVILNYLSLTNKFINFSNVSSFRASYLPALELVMIPSPGREQSRNQPPWGKCVCFLSVSPSTPEPHLSFTVSSTWRHFHPHRCSWLSQSWLIFPFMSLATICDYLLIDCVFFSICTTTREAENFFSKRINSK